MAKNVKETDVRVNMLNSIMNTPHKEIDPLIPVHVNAESVDPLFYVKMAIWYATNGAIRDHKKLFAAKVIASEYPEFRAVGEKLLTMMGVRDVAEAAGVCEKHFKGKTGGKYRRLRKTISSIITKIEEVSQKDNGIQLLRNSDTVRSLIVKFHLPTKYDRTAASLRYKGYKGKEMYDAFSAIRAIAAGDQSEKHVCTLIDKYKLPPLQVMGAIKELTPAIAAAMLKGMSSTETVNFMKMFERKGLTNIAEFTKAVEKKVTQGPKAASASMRSAKAAQSLNSGAGAEVMTKITDNFVKELPRIKKSVVLAIDRSFSMHEAIAVGKELATILAAVVDNPAKNLNVCVYNNTAAEIAIGDKNEHSDFEARFRYIKANGTTALGSVIEYIDNKGITPDVVVFIGDADESDTPFLDGALAKSTNVIGAKLINCKVGNPTFDLNISKGTVVAKSLEIENIDYKGDYYSLPNLVRVIASGGIKDTIAEIEAIDLDAFVAVAA